MHVFLTGGSVYIGSAILRRLVADGHRAECGAHGNCDRDLEQTAWIGTTSLRHAANAVDARDHHLGATKCAQADNGRARRANVRGLSAAETVDP
jgi:nucleoside-diphosphate-sugar epimerase